MCAFMCVCMRSCVYVQTHKCCPHLLLSPRSCSVLHCAAVRCSALQCAAVHFSALQCAAVCCSVLQCFAVCCSAHLNHIRIPTNFTSNPTHFNHNQQSFHSSSSLPLPPSLLCVAVCCSVLQCATVCAAGCSGHLFRFPCPPSVPVS